jgi:hypothetical protein
MSDKVLGTPYQLFKTDESIEVEKGITLDYGDFRIRIARAGGSNKKYVKLMNARLRPHRRRIETDTLEESVATSVMIELYADSIVLGWYSKNGNGEFVEGIHDENGGIMPYTRENVIKTFQALPELFSDVRIQSDKAALFRAEELDIDGKKSVTA